MRNFEEGLKLRTSSYNGAYTVTVDSNRDPQPYFIPSRYISMDLSHRSTAEIENLFRLSVKLNGNPSNLRRNTCGKITVHKKPLLSYFTCLVLAAMINHVDIHLGMQYNGSFHNIRDKPVQRGTV